MGSKVQRFGLEKKTANGILLLYRYRHAERSPRIIVLLVKTPANTGGMK